jgi:hypothetical protein
MLLVLRPWTVKKAVPFVRAVHRRLPRVQGAMWAVSVRRLGDVVGVALVGHPARELMDDDILAVLRVAVLPGYPNACSMLYGSCSRSARDMGAEDLVTYTHLDEHGASLRASGWACGGATDGGEWSREGRQRNLAIDALPKLRWWAPWGVRAKRALAMRSGTETGTASR